MVICFDLHYAFLFVAGECHFPRNTISILVSKAIFCPKEKLNKIVVSCWRPRKNSSDLTNFEPIMFLILFWAPFLTKAIPIIPLDAVCVSCLLVSTDKSV